MSIQYICPACGAEFAGSERLDGRRVKCPQCDEMIAPQAKDRSTVKLEPPAADADDTVILAAVDPPQEEAPTGAKSQAPDSKQRTPGSTQEPVEVTDAVEALAALPMTDPVIPPGKAKPPIRKPAPPRGIPLSPATKPLVARPRRSSTAEIDMTPMVDVTFLLLIFFMVTATFTMQKSLAVPKTPDQDPSTVVVPDDQVEQSDFVTVIVDEFNTFNVITVDWEREAPSEQDLHRALREARDGDSTGTIPSKLRVEAHGDAKHARVVAAIDAGTASGFEQVMLASSLDE